MNLSAESTRTKLYKLLEAILITTQVIEIERAKQQILTEAIEHENGKYSAFRYKDIVLSTGVSSQIWYKHDLPTHLQDRCEREVRQATQDANTRWHQIRAYLRYTLSICNTLDELREVWPKHLFNYIPRHLLVGMDTDLLNPRITVYLEKQANQTTLSYIAAVNEQILINTILR